MAVVEGRANPWVGEGRKPNPMVGEGPRGDEVIEEEFLGYDDADFFGV